MRQWRNRYYYRPERLVLLATRGDSGADEWSAAPDPLDELGSAEARNTISPQQRGTSLPGKRPAMNRPRAWTGSWHSRAAK